jgi:hypothetical protein
MADVSQEGLVIPARIVGLVATAESGRFAFNKTDSKWLVGIEYGTEEDFDEDDGCAVYATGSTLQEAFTQFLKLVDE